MQYFTETAYSHREALAKIQNIYGERAKILTHRTVRLGGFMGMFTREGVELTGYIGEEKGKSRLEEEKRKILKNVKDDQTLQLVLKEVQSLKSQLAETGGVEEEEHPTIARIEQLLEQNDFTVSFVKGIANRLRKEFSLDALDDFEAVQDAVVIWVADSLSIFSESFSRKPKILVLVGPTGVGKTTTIAKLAAVHGIGHNGNTPKRVRMITIDNYRIGAKNQIETYGDIMGIPVECVETYQDLKKKIALFQESDLILVDTIGKSPRDYMKLAEMQELLDACGSQTEVYLAVSATTKATDLREILQQFEPFGYVALVITKLDETLKLGNVVSVLSDKPKPIAYVTDGQVVPQDIERASVARLLMHLDGFRVDQEKIKNSYDGVTYSAHDKRGVAI